MKQGGGAAMPLREGTDAHSTFFEAGKLGFWGVSLGKAAEMPVLGGFAPRTDAVKPGIHGENPGIGARFLGFLE